MSVSKTTTTTVQPSLGEIIPVEGWVRLGILFLCFSLLYFRWFFQQHAFSWDSFEDWGHSYFVPLVSGWLVWRKRAEIARTPVSTFWPGVCPLVCGVACYFFFVVGVPNHMGQGLAILLSLSGLVMLLTGPAMFGALFVPLAYLGFAITVSEQVMTKATFPLQTIAAKGAWLFLSLLQGVFGYDVDCAGNTLHIWYNGTDIPLNVAEQCSGMRMIVAFLAMGAAIAAMERHWWHRIALVLIATPVAVFLNVIRVTTLGLASLYSPGLATGSAHMLIGSLLLLPGLFLFMGCSWCIRKTMSDDPVSVQKGGAS